jgi:toxin ParE1/3/4
MSYRLIIGPMAEADLIALYTFIRDERQDPTIAIQYLRRIRDFCQNLAELPKRGRKRDDLRQGLRLIGFERRVVVAYRIIENNVDIRRIFYGGRDYETLLEEGE